MKVIAGITVLMAGSMAGIYYGYSYLMGGDRPWGAMNINRTMRARPTVGSVRFAGER
jgi:hypothetical protein